MAVWLWDMFYNHKLKYLLKEQLKWIACSYGKVTVWRMGCKCSSMYTLVHDASGSPSVCLSWQLGDYKKKVLLRASVDKNVMR